MIIQHTKVLSKIMKSNRDNLQVHQKIFSKFLLKKNGKMWPILKVRVLTTIHLLSAKYSKFYWLSSSHFHISLMKISLRDIGDKGQFSNWIRIRIELVWENFLGLLIYCHHKYLCYIILCLLMYKVFSIM